MNECLRFRMACHSLGHMKREEVSLAIVMMLMMFAYAWIGMGVTYVAAQFALVNESAGISSMHTAITRFGTAIMLDRTNIGPSQIILPSGRCRDNPHELVLKHDCTAHSVMFDPDSNTVRPLFIYTDTWCSSGAFLPDGTLLQTGGDFEGLNKIRRFTPCPPDNTCDWVEDNVATLADGRWYSTNHLLPDGRVIVVGGRQVFTYEFVPKTAGLPDKFELPFLAQTKNFEDDNLYPYVYLLPDGNLYIFANRDSIILDYTTNRVVRTFPPIPGEPRNYPSAGSSVMLPLETIEGFTKVEVVVCGGAQLGAFKNPRRFELPCSSTCGRMEVTADQPLWTMETMPRRRCMGDMVSLPTRDVIIINGAASGSQGYGFAANPVLEPVLYRPDMPTNMRFVVQPPARIPRMYHSTANLLPDGRVLLAGSNTHAFYTFTGEFPTELRVEAWSPPYLDGRFNVRRPINVVAPPTIRYNRPFDITFRVRSAPGVIEVNLLSIPFTTHSFSQGQRVIHLPVTMPTPLGPNLVVTSTAPITANIAPPSYYMLFVVNSGIPSTAVWVQCF